ncbi:hypothetical protein [Lutibaculum baratangense]|uniref:Putative membrane protein n=1 Tax=Lutibaculum baratangense AMV1 TaxID=631454 RepID=V4RQW6_9HYPH|nr:hypothetical protein [Lutibaculum baratangense]ESR25535.1 putative membrane protein [Lutibaculum baratangense AMV1]
MRDFSNEIHRLETQIEHLSDQIERCRKADLAARLAMLLGAAWLAAVVMGFLPGDGAAVLVAIAALLFGIVLFGSNRSTWRGLRERLEAAEAQRNALIDRSDLLSVSEPRLPESLSR